MNNNRAPISFDEIPVVLRVEDLKPILGIGLNTAYDLVRSGRIRSVRVGNQIRISKTAVLDFINSGK